MARTKTHHIARSPEGLIVGVRTSNRPYTHALLHMEDGQVCDVSFHQSEALASKAANKARPSNLWDQFLIVPSETQVGGPRPKLDPAPASAVNTPASSFDRHLVSADDRAAYRLWHGLVGHSVFHVNGREAVLDGVDLGANYRGVLLHVTRADGVRDVWPQAVASAD